MTFESITNRGEFFSNHYLDAVIAGDLTDIRRRWDDDRGQPRAVHPVPPAGPARPVLRCPGGGGGGDAPGPRGPPPCTSCTT